MRFLLAAALAAGPALSATAGTTVLHDYKDWVVMRHDEGCSAATTNANGTTMLIAADGANLFAVFGDERWHMQPHTTDVTLDVGAVTWSLLDGVAEGDTLTVDLLEDTEGDLAWQFLGQLARGSAATLQRPSGVHLATFSLDGSAAAIFRLALCVQSLGSPSAPVIAETATMTWATYQDQPETAYIVVSGPFSADSGDTFSALAEAVAARGFPPENVYVYLSSEGGALIAGIVIGEEIRERGWSTIVDEACYSSCALAWLGGARLFADSEAIVGFHQASDDAGVSVQANALVGAYVAKLGYGYETAMAIVQASPDDMTILDVEQTADAGLDVVILK